MSSVPYFVLDDPASLCFLNTTKTMMDKTSRLFVGSSIFICSLLSLILNTIVVLSIMCHWKTFKGQDVQPFTQFVLSMITAGTIYTLVNFFVSIPCSLDYCSYLSNDTLLMILSLPNTLSFIAYLLANFGFCIYRFCIIFGLMKLHHKAIQLATLYIPWILAIYAVCDTTYRGCIKRFNRWSIGYTYNCSNCSVWFGFNFVDVNFYAGQVLPILMCTMYIVMIIDIYLKRRGKGFVVSSSVSDAKLTFQYFLVCSVQYLASFLFYIVPKFGNGHVLAVAGMNIIGVVDVGVNPLILLIFNAKVRESLITLFSFLPCCESNRKATISILTTYPVNSIKALA